MPSLPDEDVLRPLLTRLAVAPEDVEALIDTLPALRDPDLSARLEHYQRLLVDAIGDVAPFERWPALPGRDCDDAARLFYAYVFLATVPDARRAHAGRAIPDDVSWATLADLGRQLRVHRRIFGRAGLHTQDWLVLHFRCLLVALGRLQFNLVGDYHRLPDEPLLGVHVPETGPLDPDACDRSLRRAADFFGRHFPDWPARRAVCTSWLLDPQLAEYLPADSNILRFQRRFTQLSEGREGDRDVFEFVFRTPGVDPDAVPQRTTLERGVVAHVRAGRHWRIVSGWLPLR